MSPVEARDPFPIIQRRPRRPFFSFLSRRYSFFVGCFLWMILAVSSAHIAPWLTGITFAGYLAYTLGRELLPKNRLLWQAYKSTGGQLARSVGLILTVTLFLFLLYTQTPYLETFSGRDTLWLLLVMGAFVMSQHGSTELLLGVLVLVSCCLAFLDITSANTFDVYLALSIAAKTLWIWVLAFVLHVMIRRVTDWYSNVQLLNHIEKRLMPIRGMSDESGLLQNAATWVADSFGYPHVNIFYVQADKALMCVAGACTGGQELAKCGFVLEAGKGIIGEAIRKRRPYWANSVRSDGHYWPHDAFPKTKAELAVPIRLEDQIIGVLDIQVHHENFFLEQDVEVMENLAGDLGRVIDNVRLHTDITRAMRSRQRINEIVKRITRRVLMHAELEKTLTDIVEAAHEELECDVVMLYERNPSTNLVFGPVYAGKLQDETAIGKGSRTSGSLVYRLLSANTDYYHDSVNDPSARFPPSEAHVSRGVPTFDEREGIMSRAILRLQLDGTTFGLLFLNYRLPRTFSSEDKDTFYAFANLAALAIERAQSQEGTLRAERHDTANLIHDLLKSPCDGVEKLITATLLVGKLAPDDFDRLAMAHDGILELAHDIRYLNDTLRATVTSDLHNEIEKLVKWLQTAYSIRCEVEWLGANNYVSAVIVPSLRLILNEASLNAIKHGQATLIKYIVSVAERRLNLTIQDNGIGFNPKGPLPGGIENIRERALRLGGVATITSDKRTGTRIEISIPISER